MSRLKEYYHRATLKDAETRFGVFRIKVEDSLLRPGIFNVIYFPVNFF